MVKIAFAGGSGNVASEIIDVLVATKKHEILILTRKEVKDSSPDSRGITWIKADYESVESLTSVLQGVHTVFSFVTEQDGEDSPKQRRLVDAAIKAGVKRFAPSEWGSREIGPMSWYTYKGDMRRYLKELNKDQKVIEYSLFQCGMFTNYFTRPYPSSKHIMMMEAIIDLEKRRAILIEGGDNAIVTLTTVQDVAGVVARAVEYEGEWPEIGGIKGTDMASEPTIGELVAFGEKIRGDKPWNIKRIKNEEVEDLSWENDWIPRAEHPSIPPEQVDSISKFMWTRLLKAFSTECHHVSDEWNKLLPDYEVTQAEPFLRAVWEGKP
ncbi:NAD(P)-binding protein [Lophiostoma macrostomum CBS 122681]|uniref:NAD(P)-binding protein n=1 Tax=Lophiostoma macrostomum CBS 122681 TaxID=1314788 RepID=A0A6A6TB22_9PLEO|nr:NAD(P)-binding protein [Lophiostoma macrostomum CBS 122681]